MIPLIHSKQVDDRLPKALAPTISEKVTNGRFESAPYLMMANAINQQIIPFDRQRLRRRFGVDDFRISQIACLYFRLPLHRRALISGAGLAGLATSLVLRKRGYEVVLAEKRDRTVKQRFTHPHDWISTDCDIACPDPNCGGVFKMKRIGKRKFHHHEVTATKLHHD